MKPRNLLAAAIVLVATAPAVAQEPTPITPMASAGPAAAPSPAPVPPDSIPVVTQPQFSITGADDDLASQMQNLDQRTMLLTRQAEQVEALARIATACRSAGLTADACQAHAVSQPPVSGGPGGRLPSASGTAEEGSIVVQRVTGAGSDLQAILLFPTGAALPVRAGAELPDGQRVVQVYPTGVLVRDQDGGSSILGFSATAHRPQARRDSPFPQGIPN